MSNDVGNSTEEQVQAETLDFESLLRGSMDELMARTQSHQQAWAFGTEEEWLLDQDAGQLTFKFPGRSSFAPVQIIGTYNTQTATWLWAWANPLIADHLKADALRLREYGEQWGIQRLTAPEWAGQESDCWYMAALACRLFGSQGAYRGPAAGSHTLMIFGEISHNPSLDDRDQIVKNFTEDTATEFKACAEDTAAQRHACCRYFRRGQTMGFSQSELIDLLGLAMPSVLDVAGYLPDDAERIMDMVGEISDQEIQNSCAASAA